MGKQKTIMLLITYSCNLRCSYCYEPKTKKFKMTPEYAKRVIKDQVDLLGPEYDSVEIHFMGGEPLLEYSLIKGVSEWIWGLSWNNKQMVLFAPTNGTLLTEEMKSWFFSNKDRIQLGLSFDGNMVMQNANRSMSFNQIDLDFFVKTWPDQSVKMTISPQTIGGLYDGVKFLHSRGFKYITADLAMGKSVEWTKESLRTFQMEIGRLIDFYLENPQLIPVSMLRLNILALLKDNKQPSKTCNCGEDLVCVDWTGKTYACHLFSPISLPLDKASIGAQKFDFNNHTQFNDGVCASCLLNKICSHCYGMNYLCSDDINKPASFHCCAFKLQFVANCRFALKLAKRDNDIQLEKKVFQVLHLIN